MDDVGVSAYVINQNGQVLGESTEPNFEVTQLMPWTDYNFTVRARDAVGNISLEALDLELKTPDTEFPQWNVNEQLNATIVSSTSVTLSWPPAYDDVSVVAYEVSRCVFLIRLGVKVLSMWSINLILGQNTISK